MTQTKYAIVEVNGKQYRAEEGKTLMVDRFAKQVGEEISLDKVLLISGEAGVKVGNPYVEGASIKATIDSEIKGDKVVVFKYKPKKDYRLTQGHREIYTVLNIKEFVGA
ncbi:MAG TPA: 50S ribosomal protein L21 [Spirochaetales bacterium]|nr:50S ribosomal protein L21 [Spirochaetales bacterium]